MKTKGIYLSWIVVSDIEKAIQFYTEVVGLKLKEYHKEFGWAELNGSEGGTSLGIAQEHGSSEIKVGQNAVVTITVDDIQQAIEDYRKKGVRLVGNVMEVPGHVKLQTFVDKDGNTLQLVQDISK